MQAFIMVPFSENEVSNIKLCILIKSWTYRAWATKLDFQLLWAWWKTSEQRCHFPFLSFSQSLRSENLLALELKRQPGEMRVWAIYQKHTEKDDASKTIRNPALNSFCCDASYCFPQVDLLLQVSGDRQTCLELRDKGYRRCLACWKACAIKWEKPKEWAKPSAWTSSLCSRKSLISFHSWSFGTS